MGLLWLEMLNSLKNTSPLVWVCHLPFSFPWGWGMQQDIHCWRRQVPLTQQLEEGNAQFHGWSWGDGRGFRVRLITASTSFYSSRTSPYQSYLIRLAVDPATDYQAYTHYVRWGSGHIWFQGKGIKERMEVSQVGLLNVNRELYHPISPRIWPSYAHTRSMTDSLSHLECFLPHVPTQLRTIQRNPFMPHRWSLLHFSLSLSLFIFFVPQSTPISCLP